MQKIFLCMVAILSTTGSLLFGQISADPNWTEPTPLPDAGGPATGNVGNNMAILSTGRIILIYNQTRSQGGMRLYITSTENDGASWQTPVALSVADTLIGSSTATIAADVDDVLHLTWTAKAPVVALYYSKSADAGVSWSPAQILYQNPRHKIAYHSVTVDRQRRVHVSWHDGDTDGDNMPAETWYARSVDQGETWETARMLSTDDGMHSAFARSDFSGTDSDTLLFVWRDNRAGGDEWDVYGAFSYDGGASWVEHLIAGGSGRQWDPMALIDKQGSIHVGVMDYPAGHQIDVFVWYFNTSDGGATWSPKKTMRGARTIFPFYTYDYSNDIIWYFLRLESPPGPDPISDLGVRYTLDGGASWSDLEQLTALQTGGTKFPAIATGIDGIVRLTYSLKDSNGDDKLYFQKRISAPVITNVDERVAGIPGTFELRQNYPNPFNPETTIRYSVGNSSRVQIRIYNIVGQLILTVLDEQKAGGEYTVVWDGRDGSGRSVASGVYIYEMRVAGQALQRSLVLLR